MLWPRAQSCLFDYSIPAQNCHKECMGAETPYSRDSATTIDYKISYVNKVDK